MKILLFSRYGSLGASSRVRYLQYFSARMLNTRALNKKGYHTNSNFKKIVLYVSKILINDLVKFFLLRIVRNFNKSNTKLIGHYFGRAPFLKTSFKKSYLSKQNYVKFENLSLPVPSEVEKYLTIRYGPNYMSLPSEEEKKKYPSYAYIVDTFKSYKEYM